MAKVEKGDRSASDVDRRIGLRVRARRIELEMSQDKLAAEIGVTFQQIQKYEKGVNRIAASTLLEIANALGVEVGALVPQPGKYEAASTLDDPEFAALLGKLNADGRRILAGVARLFAQDDKLKATRK